MPRAKLTELALAAVLTVALLAGCYPNPAPPGLTPIPTLAGRSAMLTPVAAVAEQPTQAPSDESGQGGGDAAQVAEGQALYGQYCAACHGATGSEGGVGPALADSEFVSTAGEEGVHDVIANGRPGTAMPAWSQARGGSLNDEQIQSLVAFISSLQ